MKRNTTKARKTLPTANFPLTLEVILEEKLSSDGFKKIYNLMTRSFNLLIKRIVVVKLYIRFLSLAFFKRTISI